MTAKALQEAQGRPLVVLTAMLVLWILMRFELWPHEALQGIGELLPRALSAGADGEALALSAPGDVTMASMPAKAEMKTSPELNESMGERTKGQLSPRSAPDGTGIQSMVRRVEAGSRGMFSDPAPAIPVRIGAARSIPRRRVEAPPPDRWSLDAWLFARDGGGALSAAPRSYGAGQAGAVLRYRLVPGNRFAPTAYARATASPDGTNPAELAVGVAARPLPSVPVDAQIELRLRERGGRIEARPAVALVGGFDRTVAGIEARGYGQAGYVAGADATGFVDGKLTLEKAAAAGSGFRLAAGGGAWGGAQRDAARLDIGPSASFTVATERITARIEVDYRFRIAGDASPGSGPALTISASF